MSHPLLTGCLAYCGAGIPGTYDPINVENCVTVNR